MVGSESDSKTFTDNIYYEMVKNINVEKCLGADQGQRDAHPHASKSATVLHRYSYCEK